MADLWPLAALLATLYGTALLGQASALVLRACLRRGGRILSASEAGLCAWLPPLSLLAIPLARLLYPYAAGSLGTAHAAWHRWERSLHAAPAAHDLLNLVPLLLLGGGVCSLARIVYGCARAHEVASALERAKPKRVGGSELPLFRLSIERPLCFTVGLLRPRIYISAGLLERLSPRDRQAVLAHEAAHIGRRDGWTGALLSGFYTLLPLPGSRALLREWERAAERACDAEAARHVGDPCAVATALVGVARLVTPGAVPGAAHFAAPGGEDIEGRVRALLALPVSGSPGRRRPSLLLPAFTTLHLLAVLGAETWIRHAAELLVLH